MKREEKERKKKKKKNIQKHIYISSNRETKLSPMHIPITNNE